MKENLHFKDTTITHNGELSEHPASAVVVMAESHFHYNSPFSLL